MNEATAALREAIRHEADLTDQKLEAIAEKAAEKAIDGFFMRIGINTADPIEMQKDFAHLRKWRQGVEQVVPVSIKTSVIVIITGLLGAAYALFPHAAAK